MNKVVITNNSSKYIFLFKKNLIRSLIENGYSVTVISPRDEYSKRLHDIGVNYCPVVIDTNGLNPFLDFVYLINLVNIYRRIRPDFNLLYTIKPNIYGTVASSFFGIKTFNNITGLGSVFLKPGVVQSIVKFLYKYSFKLSTKVMFQNPEDRDFFTEQGLVSLQKTVLIPGSGVDIDWFRPADTSCKKQMIFLMIGRVLIDKGVLEYVEAARLVRNQFSDVEFWLLGACDSDNRSSIDCEQVKVWENMGVIKYLGEVEDIRGFISKSDVVVLPSYREGVPRVLLEALSMERPIIGSNVPGCREVVNDGVNGYFCKVKDAFDLSKQMTKMISLDHDKREMMGKNGRIEVLKKFDEEIVIKRYIQLLKSFANDDS